MSSRTADTKSRKQKETEDYLTRIKLKEVFQACLLVNSCTITSAQTDQLPTLSEKLPKLAVLPIPPKLASLKVFTVFNLPSIQALLLQVITSQPDDPIGYFHEEITKIKKEMEELNVSHGIIITVVSS